MPPRWFNFHVPNLLNWSIVQPMIKPARSPLLRYGVALLSVLLALLLMLLLDRWVPMHGSPFLVFFAAVMVSAWYGGFGAGLCATAISAMFAVYFFLPPDRSITLSNISDLVRVGLFVLIALMITFLSSARRQLVKTLGRERDLIAAIVSTADSLIMVLDRQGKIIQFNRACEQLTGYLFTEVRGKYPWELFLLSEEIEPVKHIFQELCLGAAPNAYEHYWFAKDGSRHLIAWSNNVLLDDRGAVSYVICTGLDITERKQAEAALRLSQERLTSFVEANVVGILFGDISGGIKEANDEFLRIVGYSRDDLQSGALRWTHITPSEYLPLDEKAIRAALLEGGCTPYEKEYIRKDGSRVPVLIGFGLLGEERQQTIAFILDLTERKRLEQALRTQAEQLAQANRMKDEFLAVLSHELRTPLNSILGWSRLLRTRPFDAATTTRALETIERNARLQNQLVDDILDISKITQGKLYLHPRAVDLVSVVTAVIEAVRPAATAKSIAIRLDNTLPTEESAPSLSVLGDPDRLQQAVWNLLSNAIKFTPEGGRVDVQLSIAQSSKPQAQITITDTGKGIDAEFLPFVFDRFRQADSSSTRAEGGLGLGLAIVRQLVELHGGTIQVDSPGVGQGTTSVITLPMMRAEG